MLEQSLDRRRAFAVLGGTAALAALPGVSLAQDAMRRPDAVASGLAHWRTCPQARRRTGRRGFDKVPFMIDRADLWDHEASEILLSFRGDKKQMWEASDISSAWLNLMRESEWSGIRPPASGFPRGRGGARDSASHVVPIRACGIGMGWRRTQAASLRRTHSLPSGKGRPDRRSTKDRRLLRRRQQQHPDPATAWGCDDRLPRLDPRDRPRSGEIGRRDPDMVAADLTNNLIEGVVLVPSVVAYIVELQNAGFTMRRLRKRTDVLTN
jgi:hypothetical protein